jgi:hypothetical protein
LRHDEYQECLWATPAWTAPYSNRRNPYDVLKVSRDGSTRIFQSYNRKANSA